MVNNGTAAVPIQLDTVVPMYWHVSEGSNGPAEGSELPEQRFTCQLLPFTAPATEAETFQLPAKLQELQSLSLGAGIMLLGPGDNLTCLSDASAFDSLVPVPPGVLVFATPVLAASAQLVVGATPTLHVVVDKTKCGSTGGVCAAGSCCIILKC